MRAFVGISMPSSVASALEAAMKRLGKAGISAKFVEPENLHICLRFLGEVDDIGIGQAKEAMQTAAAKFKPFTIEVSCIGTFPPGKFVRVIWAGVRKGAQELTGLASMLGSSEDREFTPHITLARVANVKDKPGLEKALKELENADFGSFEAAKISLMKSELTPQGPVHTEIFHVKLS